MSKRKSLLTGLVSTFCIVGLVGLAFVFVTALKPNASSSVNGEFRYGIMSLKVSEEFSSELSGRPILIQRLTETEFRVFEMISRNVSPTISGCLVIRSTHAGYDDAAFIDPCRGNIFDSDGNSLSVNSPGTLPLARLDWHLENEYIYVSPGFSDRKNEPEN